MNHSCSGSACETYHGGKDDIQICPCAICSIDAAHGHRFAVPLMQFEGLRGTQRRTQLFVADLPMGSDYHVPPGFVGAPQLKPEQKSSTCAQAIRLYMATNLKRLPCKVLFAYSSPSHIMFTVLVPGSATSKTPALPGQSAALLATLGSEPQVITFALICLRASTCERLDSLPVVTKIFAADFTIGAAHDSSGG